MKEHVLYHSVSGYEFFAFLFLRIDADACDKGKRRSKIKVKVAFGGRAGKGGKKTGFEGFSIQGQRGVSFLPVALPLSSISPPSLSLYCPWLSTALSTPSMAYTIHL